MKIIGFSSGVIGRESNVDRMVKAIMDKSGGESEFVKLTDLNYSACKGCVWLCAEPQICRLEDDLLLYIQKVKEADAVVLGSPIHFSTVNAAMLSFISRLWGFRHVTIPIKNKPFVLALSGSGNVRSDTSADDFRRAMMPFQVSIVDVVSYYSKIPPCYSCGRHQECRIGGAFMIWGEKTPTLPITPELFRRWEDRPETVAKIEAAADKLKRSISGGVGKSENLSGRTLKQRRSMMGVKYLSDEWFAKLEELAEEVNLEIPDQMMDMKINMTVTSDEGDCDFCLNGGRIQKGHLPDATTKVIVPMEDAKKIFIEQDQSAGMQAFMSGKLKIEGDMSKMMALQSIQPTESQKKLQEMVKEITE